MCTLLTSYFNEDTLYLSMADACVIVNTNTLQKDTNPPFIIFYVLVVYH